MKVTANQAISDAVWETLEQRQMMSAVSFHAGVLTLRGFENQTNEITVKLTNNGTKVQAISNSESFRYRLGSVKSIKVIGGTKADSIRIEPTLAVPVRVETFAGNDTIVTGNGADSVHAGNGNDAVYTGGGNDVIDGQAGNDTLNGGDGNDAVRGGNNKVTLRGEAGNDVLIAGKGHARLLGGPGNDTLIAGPAALLNGEAGEDIKTVLPTGTTSSGVGEVKNPIPGGTVTPIPKSPVVVAVPKVTSFTLINAETNEPVHGYTSINTGNVLDLGKLPKQLSIRANLANGGARVQFDYNGQVNYHTENGAPYAIASDNAGDYNAWTPVLGENTLTASTVTDGKLSGALTVKFKVINSASTTTPTTPTVPTTPTTPTVPTVPTTPTTPTPDAAAPKAKITAISATVAAGQTIHVQATGTVLKNGDFHTAQYDWDFGDGNVAFNKLRGFNAAHTYDTAGKFTVTLTVTDAAGKVSTTKLDVTIAAANRKTIYVSNSGSDTNSGLSANSPVKTPARAFALMDDNSQVLFKRGEVFKITAGLTVDSNNSVVGAYGIGDRPTIKWDGVRERVTMVSFASGVRDATVQDISFDTKFNTDTDQTNMPFALRPAGTNITIRRNEFLNVGYAINNNLKPTGVMIQDNVAPLKTGLRDYFCWASGNDLVILHNTVANTTREHVIRVSGIDRILLAYNDLTSLDRRNDGDPYDSAKGAIVVQQGQFAYVFGNKIHGPSGAGPLGDADGLKSKENRFKYSVFEGNEIFDTMYMNHGAEHTTVRNNVFRAEDKVAIRIDGYNDTYGRGVVDMVIDNNTATNSAANGSFLVLGGHAQGLVLTDNLYVAPNLAPGAYGTAAVRVIDDDLSSFTKINGNTWPAATKALSYAAGGINYIGSSMTSSGYQTGAEWNALAQVGDDRAENVLLKTGVYSLTLNGSVIGAQLAA